MGDTHFDAVIVGSGFGGAVMAYRLAQAGRRVCVLERGKAFPPGSFPRSPYKMRENFWDPSAGLHGMYNVWRFKGLDALVSAGLGGGSLIYANVLIRKDEKWFVREESSGGPYEYWPVTREDLDPHYVEAERMIGVSPFPQHLRAVTPKVREYEAAARKLGLQHGYPPLAVTFSGPDRAPGEPIAEAHGNMHGQTRNTCRLCGECDIGCNFGSKNSLDFTYLSAAARAGAELRTRCEVCMFEPVRGGGYRVEYTDYSAGGSDTEGLTPKVLTCGVLVLSAGTLGSTYLMLKNRASFPGLSGALGTRFSGNGDFLGMALNATDTDHGRPRVLDPSRGPVITSYVRMPDDADGPEGQTQATGPGGRGLYVEDAGYPEFFNWLIEGARTVTGWERIGRYVTNLIRKSLGVDPDTDLGKEVADLFGDTLMSKSSLPMLGMGRDVADGRMYLDGGWLNVDWKLGQSSAYFDRMRATMAAMAGALGADYQDSPLWSVLKRLITVHPLGGCPMGRHASEGVVDSFGEVFGFRGLFIADGSVMPGAVGPNPSLTIAALANRFADRVVDRARAPS